MKKVFFSHPQNSYGEPIERECLLLIAEKFPGYEIVNPSDQIHQDEIAKLRAKDPKANVMPYFFALAGSCDSLVALPFGDSKWGAGVSGEADQMHRKNHFVWAIHPAARKITFVPEVPAELKLTVEETRARIRNPDGSSKPYA